MEKVKFEFNEKGICMNPETEVLFQNPDRYICIAYAKKANNWSFGYRVVTSPGEKGHMMPVTFKHGHLTFETVKEARTAAIDKVCSLLEEKGEGQVVHFIRQLDFFLNE